MCGEHLEKGGELLPRYESRTCLDQVSAKEENLKA